MLASFSSMSFSSELILSSAFLVFLDIIQISRYYPNIEILYKYRDIIQISRCYTNIEILYKYRDIIQISRLNITFMGEIYKNDKSLLDFKLLWYHECHYWNEASSVSLLQFSGCFQNNMYTINLTEQSTLFILIINTYLWQVLMATFALVICPATSSIALVSTSTRPY